MNEEDRIKVVENYYRASNALIEIGGIYDLPEELMQLTINASSALLKIVYYLNTHRE